MTPIRKELSVHAGLHAVRRMRTVLGGVVEHSALPILNRAEPTCESFGKRRYARCVRQPLCTFSEESSRAQGRIIKHCQTVESHSFPRPMLTLPSAAKPRRRREIRAKPRDRNCKVRITGDDTPMEAPKNTTRRWRERKSWKRRNRSKEKNGAEKQRTRYLKR